MRKTRTQNTRTQSQRAQQNDTSWQQEQTTTSQSGDVFGFNPSQFLNNDFSKIWSNVKMPQLDIEGLMQSQRMNMEALTAANQLAVEGVQALFRRQAETTRQLLEDSTGLMQTAIAPASPEDKILQQTDWLQAMFERCVENTRDMVDMMAKSNHETADLINGRISAQMSEFKQALKRSA